MQDDLIYKRGEVGREMYVIMEGNVQISFTDSAAKALSPGQTFGEGMSSLCLPPCGLRFFSIVLLEFIFCSLDGPLHCFDSGVDLAVQLF